MICHYIFLSSEEALALQLMYLYIYIFIYIGMSASIIKVSWNVFFIFNKPDFYFR